MTAHLRFIRRRLPSQSVISGSALAPVRRWPGVFVAFLRPVGPRKEPGARAGGACLPGPAPFTAARGQRARPPAAVHP